jgi:hypothetical protein
MLHDWFSSGAATDDDRAVLHDVAAGTGAVVISAFRN